MDNMDSDSSTPLYMSLAPLKFALRSGEHRGDADLERRLLAGIEAGNMAPYYLEVCGDLDWKIDPALLTKMEEANAAHLAQFELDIDHDGTAVDSEGKMWHEKLLYLCSIGDKFAAIKLATAKSEDKMLSLNRRLDAVFALFRVAYFHGCDVKAMRSAIDKAAHLIDTSGSGGDWSARNKLKAYDALCSLAFRDYTKAAPLFLDAIPTFESTELTTFESFLQYAVLAAMIALPRRDLHDSLTKPGIIPQALNASALKLREYHASLYECRYADFFTSLASVEDDMKNDPILQPHYRHYMREMKLRAYTQLLHAYRSLSLSSMAEAFGVSEELIEREVARFTATRRLQCKIDHVARCVLTGRFTHAGKTEEQATLAPRVDHDRAVMYKTVIKRGDNLLNRLKNLARVMDF